MCLGYPLGVGANGPVGAPPLAGKQPALDFPAVLAGGARAAHDHLRTVHEDDWAAALAVEGFGCGLLNIGDENGTGDAGGF